MSEALFLGKPVSYWVELDRQPKQLRVQDLIVEIGKLRAKVSSYEFRIERMNQIQGDKTL